MSALALGLLLALPQGAALPVARGQVDFAREVRPLLARRCFACHGNDEGSLAADLRLDRREDALRDRGGYAALVPGAPDESELWLRITDEADPMPPAEAGHGLEDGERQLLRRWIEEGAEYAPHWAFVAPRRPAPPEFATSPDRAWGTGAIDAFVAARLADEGLAPSPEADRATLLRRVSLDLTGLPPTPDEVRAFLADEAPDAYERAVDRLLASPHYGERWAAMWLDLARYADSAGHGSDPLRTIWRYRDWVVDAFDRNVPFDEFSTLQLAGDLVPGASDDDRLATAFHRNTMTNTEGGTDDEEFRVLAVKDRTHTTGQVWLGLTVGCAECHSHKYDPLSHREYYELFDFFNQTADTDRNDDAPRLPTPTSRQASETARITAAIAEVEARIATYEPDLADGAARLRDEERSWRQPLWARYGEERAYVDQGGAWRPPVDAAGRSRSVVELEGTGPVSAVRLRAGVADDLPRGGPGQSPGNGNFVLTDVALEHFTRAGAAPRRASRVRVELAGERRILSLAEVEVLGEDGQNLALGAAARQSSTAYDGDAGRAVDGNTDGRHEHGSVTHTATEDDPWWEVDLGGARRIARIRVHGRVDGDLEQRLAGVVVVLLDSAGNEAWRSAEWPAPDPVLEVSFELRDDARGPARVLGASASFEQQGFPVGAAHDPDPASGWAIGPRQGEAHEAVLRVSTPSGFGEGSGARRDGLRLTIAQGYGDAHVIGALRLEVTALDPPPRALSADVRRALESPPAAWTDADRTALRAHLLADDPEVSRLQERIAALRRERDMLGVVTTPVMVELTGDARRRSHVLHKGNFLEPGEPVAAATPVALHPFPAEAPRDRLGLARWLFDDANPLTARVHVNRLWARLFGRGIVLTEEDFGVQGELPTHPALLDWLAVEFREGGWDQKALLRTIVTSATYRQASNVTPTLLERDPTGELLSRYPRQRLTAEMVRDATLAAAGLLSPKKFGPSVFPPQPDGLWQAAFNGERAWRDSMGEDRWRRGLYVFLRRTAPYPMLQTFDAPSREVCTLKRPRTNTPLQAFVTLNDPVFVEAAQALGRAMLAAPYPRDAGGDRGRVAHGLWRATQRPPRDAARDALLELLADARTAFAADKDGARAFATEPFGPLPEGADPVEAAAWTLVANAALNLDAALMKE